MNVDGDIVDGGCNGEVFIGEKGVGGDADEGDKVNENDSTTRVTRVVLKPSGVFGKEFVGRILVDLSLDSCRDVVRMFFRVKKGR